MIPVIIPYIRSDIRWTIFYHCSTNTEIEYALCCLHGHSQSVTRHYVIGEYTGNSMPDVLKKTCHRHLIGLDQRPPPVAYERQLDIKDVQIDDDKFRDLLETITNTSLMDWNDLLICYQIPSRSLFNHIAFIDNSSDSGLLLTQLRSKGVLPAIVRLPSEWAVNVWYGRNNPKWKWDMRRHIIRRYVEVYSPGSLWIWDSPMTTQWSLADYENTAENMKVDGGYILHDFNTEEHVDVGVPSGAIWKRIDDHLNIVNDQRIDIIGNGVEYEGDADMVFIQDAAEAGGFSLTAGRWVFKGDVSAALIRTYMVTDKALINGSRQLDKYTSLIHHE